MRARVTQSRASLKAIAFPMPSLAQVMMMTGVSWCIGKVKLLYSTLSHKKTRELAFTRTDPSLCSGWQKNKGLTLRSFYIPRTLNTVHIPYWVQLYRACIMGEFLFWKLSNPFWMLVSSSRWLDHSGEWVGKISHWSWRVDCDARYPRQWSDPDIRESIHQILRGVVHSVMPNVFRHLPIFMFVILKGMGNEILLSFRVKWNEKRNLALYFSGLPRFIVIRSQWREYWRNQKILKWNQDD